MFICLLISSYFFGLTDIADRNTQILSVKVEFWLTTLILFMYAKYCEKLKFLLWREQKLKPLTYLLSVLLVLFITTVVMSIIAITINQFIYKKTHTVSLGERNVFIFLFSAFTAAVTEELIFRGYLLPRIKLLLNNTWLAVIISSLIFGLAHVTNYNFIQMLNPFIIGLIFSIYYSKYQNLTVLIICHLIIDLVLF